jgi:hypothetical protein
MPDASVATSTEVKVYANWALIMVRMIRLGRSRALDRRSKQVTSRRSRTRVYCAEFVLYASIAERKGRREVTCSLPEIFDLTVLVANNHRVPRIYYRNVEYTFVFTLEQKHCLVL